MIDYDKDDIDRFYDKITVIEEGKNAGCWEVDCGKTKDGYSLIWANNTTVRAHRFMYQIWHPYENIKGLCVCHSCDHPWCVCPDHLWIGTDLDNTIDKINKGRQVKLKGSEIGTSKLTESDVEEILTNTLSGYFISIDDISSHYQISRATVNLILNQIRWSHITKNYDMSNIKSLLRQSIYGCNHYKSKLTEGNVRDIRQRLKNGESGRSVAKLYNVDQSLVSRIKLNKTYQYVI